MSTHSAHGAEGHSDGAVHVHVHPISMYLKIFGALIALTVITVLTAVFVDLDAVISPASRPGAGAFNLGLAMVIATVKATLVATWFMHLKDDSRFNALIFIGSLLFGAVFLAYTLNDTANRGQYDPYQGVHVRPDTGERAGGGPTAIDAEGRQVPCRYRGEEPEHGVPADAPFCTPGMN